MRSILKRICLCLSMFFALSLGLAACNLTPSTTPPDTQTQETITISYADDDGIHKIQVTVGKSYSIDPVPQREGYTFLGLFDRENSGGTQYIGASGLSISVCNEHSDLTLYPQWAPIEYTLLLNYGKANYAEIGNLTVDYDAPIAGLPEELFAEGNDFLGWYAEQDGSGPKFQNGAIMDMTFAKYADKNNRIPLHAVFETTRYNVKFYSADGKTLLEEKSVPHGTDISKVAPSQLSDGTQILAWSTTPNGYYEYTGPITGDSTFYVRRYSCDLTLDNNNGEPSETITVSSGESRTLPTLTRLGYSFQGWKNEEGKVVAGPGQPYTPTKSETLTAYWIALEYTVTLDLNIADGIAELKKPADGDATETVTFDSPFKLQDPTIIDDRYTFVGWFTEDGTPLTDEHGNGLGVWNTAQNITAVAHFSIIQFVVSFYTGNADPVSPITVNKGDFVELPSATYTGHTLTCWKSPDGKLMPAGTEYTPSASTTLTAVWEANEYTVTLKPDGGSLEEGVAEEVNVIYGEPFSLPVPVRENYDFLGWFAKDGTAFTNEKGDGLDIWNVPNDMTLTANYRRIQFTITFDVNGGSDIQPKVIDKGESLILPSSTKTGHTLTNWETPDGILLQPKTAYMPTASITLTAVWEANEYTVTMQPNGGELGDETVNPVKITFGKTFSLPVPERENYEFLGWYTSAGDQLTDVYGVGLDVWSIGENSIVTARYRHIELTITFDANGGTDVGKKIVYKGDPMYLPTTTKAGHSLTGWYDSITHITYALDTPFVPQTNTNLTAQWKAHTYEIRLNVNGGSLNVSSTVKITFGKSFQFPVPTHDSSIFEGWRLESAKNGKILTSDDGNSLAVWSDAKDRDGEIIDVYASWLALTTVDMDTYSSDKLILSKSSVGLYLKGKAGKTYSVSITIEDSASPAYIYLENVNISGNIGLANNSLRPLNIVSRGISNQIEGKTDTDAINVYSLNISGTTPLTIKGGAGSASKAGGTAVSLSSTFCAQTTGALTLCGGNGGAGEAGGNGGDGGLGITCSIFKIDGALSVTIFGGNGGKGGAASGAGQKGGNGGKGGTALVANQISCYGNMSVIGGSGGNGADGAAGGTGSRGGDGGNGGSAEQTIKANQFFADSSSVVRITCGNGGNGGRGGDGGKGSTGSEGQDAYKGNAFFGAGYYFGDDGGPGGRGGDGGNGGTAGKNGEVGIQIASKNNIKIQEGTGGVGGNGGNGGKGGTGGAGGSCDGRVTGSGCTHGGNGGKGGNGGNGGNGGDGATPGEAGKAGAAGDGGIHKTTKIVCDCRGSGKSGDPGQPGHAGEKL